jgi:hypothetical protein
MAAIDKAALALTQCWTCAGCNRLEDEKFRGDDTCQQFRKADTDVLIAKRNGESSDSTETDGHTDNWRPNSTVPKVR